MSLTLEMAHGSAMVANPDTEPGASSCDRTVPPPVGDTGLKIYVGNLSFDTNEESIRNAFAAHGNVEEVAVITDRDTGRSRGFAFVTMPDSAARAAIGAMNGTELDGRSLNVNEARAKTERGGGGGGGGRSRGGW